MVQWSFKAPYCQEGTPQEPPFPEPFLSACSHPWTGPGTMSDHVGAIHLANIEILLFFLARFVFCHCSARNWLPGWSEEPQRLLELNRAHQGEVGGVGPSPFGSRDVLKLVRSSHETTSCEMERGAGHGRVTPPQVSGTNTLRTSRDTDGTSHNIPQPRAGPLNHICGFYNIVPQWAPNPTMHHAEAGSASPPPLFPLPSFGDSRADSCTGAFHIG